MTEQRHAEEALHLSEERFRLLIESVKDYAIFVLDAAGVITSWNRGAERIKGYRAQEIIGQHFSRFYPEEDVRAGKCEMELEVAARDGRCEDEGWRIRKDGTRFWANVVITPLRDPNGETVGFAKVTRDLTERRAAEYERVRLGMESREQIRQLAALSEALAGTLTAEHVGQIVAEKGTRFMHADLSTLHLLDERTMTLELVAHSGLNPALMPHIRSMTRESGNPAYAIGTGASPEVWIETPEQYLEYLPELAKLPSDGPRASAFWCVPLVAEGHTIGMIATGFFQPRKFEAHEREFVQTFARQCAQALARARRFDAERAAAALAERLRASLATTLRSIGDALIATDAQGAITLMNGVAESLTGWTEAEARGRKLPEVFRIVNEQTRAEVPNPVDRVLETGGVVGLANHTLLLARDGREIPVDDSGAPIRSESGTIDGVVLVFRDVTARKREEARRSLLVDAAAALTESLDYEETVTRVAQLAVPRLADWCTVDLVKSGDQAPKRLTVVHTDPARVQLAKALEEKFQRSPATRTAHVIRTGRSELIREVTDAYLSAASATPEQYEIARQLGLSSAIIVPLVARGEVLGAMSFIAAESRRRYDDHDLEFAEELAHRCSTAIDNARSYRGEQRARRAADVANRAKDEFLAMVSHELRTPLNAIMGWAKMLTMPGLDDARLRRGHEIIERNAVAMAQLIEDLLDMSRVISGKLRIEVQQVDLGRIIDAAIESVRPAVLAKSIELAPVLDTMLPSIVGDPTRLQQIVWNLLSNAVKFTPKGGRVRVVLQRCESSIELSVSDTGDGISPDFLAEVFEPFRQQDAGPARQRGGLGLGLAITRQLVELHGGRIVAQSEGQGRGATFIVTLPIAAVASPPERATSESDPMRTSAVFEKPEHIRGLRVLVVDDEEDARRLVATILEDCGCRVTLAGSVEEAMRAFEAEPPEVLLSDIGMPNEDGFALIRRVRALPRARGGDVPAAALTAYARAEDRRKMLSAGYSIHVPKPVEPAELVAVVATLSRFTQHA